MPIEDLMPWLLLAALGALHGLNPCMGWPMATSIGRAEQSRAAVLTALWPIGLGHLLSIGAVALAVVWFSVTVQPGWVDGIAGTLLIAFGTLRLLGWPPAGLVPGGRGRMAGLGAWSFLVSTGQGAGLMLVPVMIPLCLVGTPGRDLVADGAWPVVLGAVVVHMAALLAVVAALAVAAYEGLELKALQRLSPYRDRLWSGALIAAGLVLLV